MLIFIIEIQKASSITEKCPKRRKGEEKLVGTRLSVIEEAIERYSVVI